MTRTLFKNANLLDGNQAARTGASVSIQGDRIVSVAATSGGEDDATAVVDLDGMTLMPGMVIGHYHPAYSHAGHNAASRNFREGPGGTRNMTASRVAFAALGNAQIALRCGYTSGVGAATFYETDADLAEAIDSGIVSGPRIVPCSRALSPAHRDMPSQEEHDAILCYGADAFRDAALLEVSRGAKMLKVNAASGHGLNWVRQITPGELEAVVQVGQENGIAVRTHVTGRDMILQCVKSGVRVIDHADGMDDECIEAFLKTDSFVLPTLYLPYLAAVGRGDEKMGVAGAFDAQHYHHMTEMLAKAAAAGVKLVPGDDYGVQDLPHGDYSKELVCYVEQAGIRPLEVLRWATRNGGELMGLPDLGTLEDDKVADLVIVDGDPSADINILTDPARIVAVIKGGEVVSGSLPGGAGRRALQS